MIPLSGGTMRKIFAMTEKHITLYHVILQTEEEGLKQVRAAELLGISDRHFRRLLKAYKIKGLEGLVSKKIGRPSNNHVKKDVRTKVVERLKGKYKNCGPTFVWGKLKKENIDLSKETIRKIMIEEDLWESKQRKRVKLYQRRNRREHQGELVQMDGSPHAWFEERGPKCCLLGFIDDATSKVKHLKFVESESTVSYMVALKEYMMKHGKPQSFYSDRFTVFRVNNDKCGYRKDGLTQVGRALKELDVELICANSPQAKGRIERLFGTLQDRLVKEMRLKKIDDIEGGNKYLEEYIEEHNGLFSVEANGREDMHRPVREETLEKVLCYKEERKLTKNLEISYEGRILQVVAEDASYRMIGAKVIVREDLKGKIEIEYEGKQLGYKELLVRDHQGRVVNRKESLIREKIS